MIQHNPNADLCKDSVQTEMVFQYTEEESVDTVKNWLEKHKLRVSGPVITTVGIGGEIRKEPVPQYIMTISDSKGVEVSFPFFGSINDARILAGTHEFARGNRRYKSRLEEEKRVRDSILYTIMACIGLDRNCPQTFGEFCSELGYDEDSRKAYQTFESCLTFSQKLAKVITEEEGYAFPR